MDLFDNMEDHAKQRRTYFYSKTSFYGTFQTGLWPPRDRNHACGTADRPGHSSHLCRPLNARKEYSPGILEKWAAGTAPRRLLHLAAILCVVSLHAQDGPTRGITETYTSGDRVRSGIAIGGIGTGSLELRKDGQFYNWTLMNNWPLGNGEPFRVKSYPRDPSEQSLLFFLVRYQVEGEGPRIKLLQLNNSLSEGGLQGIAYYYPWMSAVEQIDYSACFPVTRMTFTDPDMPLRIHLDAFSPFIPADVKNSSLPGAFFNFEVESTSEKAVKVFIVATLRNLVGYDRTDKYFISHGLEGEDFSGFTMTCGGIPPDHSSYGEMGMFSLSGGSTYYLGWEHKHPYYEKLLVSERFGNIDDTQGRNQEADGKLVGRVQNGSNDQRCFSSIGVDHLLEPGGSFTHTFVLAWHFPNRYGALPGSLVTGAADYATSRQSTRLLGHFYSTYFGSCEEVGSYLASNQADLTARTLQFQEDFYNSSLEPYILDQVNSQFNTFVTSSILSKKGTFAIREGMTPEQPWGPFGTMDVSLYGSSSVIALFPELQKSMMQAHMRIQSGQGAIHHGLQEDIDLEHDSTDGVFHRIDLVPNFIQLVLRDFFWTGDREYLESMWPAVTRGIDYILTSRDKDHDMMPDMEGIMSSYDNFPMYGLASYIQSQWLAAMASVRKAAAVIGDRQTEKLAWEILQKGTRLMEEKLWNGRYYVLSNDYNGSRGVDDGILTDQLVGQWMAHQSGIGPLLEQERIRSALKQVMASSFIEEFGLRNCTWPATPDLFPIHESDLWVDQANTCWTGVELAFASLLIYEGMVEEGEKVIRTVDERYRRSGLYWDHQEFGGHYYRPMSAWSVLHAYLGLGIADGAYRFSPRLDLPEYTLFFAHGNGTAHYQRRESGIALEVRSGKMLLSSLEIADQGFNSAITGFTLNDKPVKARIKTSPGILSVSLPERIILAPGDRIEISF